MNLNARFLLWIRKIFRKYGKIIGLVLLIWILVIMINNYVGNKNNVKSLKKSYNPDKAVMDDNGNVPTKYVDQIKSTIKEYFTYCKAKEYEKAFAMLSEDCKKGAYNNDLDEFKEYVDIIYTSDDLTYYLQNYSNANNTYIYVMTISEDIELSGTTDGDDYYQEKISMIRNEDENKFYISNNNYIKNESLNKIIEEDNMKIKIVNREYTYSREMYTVTITNRTNNYIVLADSTASDEVVLNMGNKTTKATNLANNNIVIAPNGEQTISLWFKKYYDQDDKSESIAFNAVRILSKNAYKSGYESSSQVADDVYSITVPLE